MADELRLRRGTSAANDAFTGALGEVTMDTDRKSLIVHDGVKAGGFPIPNSAALLDGAGASMIGFKQTLSGTILTTADSKLRESLSFFDFLTPKQIAGVRAGNIQDLTEPLQIAAASGQTVNFPAGRYRKSAQIKLSPGTVFQGLRGPNVRMPACWFDIIDGKAPKDPQIAAAFVLNNCSGLSGFGINYPEQVANTAAQPVEYSFAISTAKAVTRSRGNTDGIVLNTLYLKNPYNGIDLTNASQYEVYSIYGQPIYRGLHIDQMYDVSRIRDVHFWTFEATPDTPLYRWIRANGIAFELLGADHLYASALFAYGYNMGFRFGTQATSQAFWGTLIGCCADVCAMPIRIETANDLQIIGGHFTTARMSEPCITTGTGDIGATLIQGATISGGSNVAIIISGSVGNVRLESLNFPDTSSGDSGTTMQIIVESTAQVIVTGCKMQRPVLGAAPTVIDGITLPPLSSSIAVSTDASQSRNWKGPAITDVKDGVSFAVGSAGATWTWPIPSGDIRQNVIVVEMTIKPSAVVDHSLLIDIVRSDGSLPIATILSSNHGGILNGTRPTRVRYPCFIGECLDDLVLRLTGRTYSSASSLSISITELAIHKADPAVLDHGVNALLLKKYYTPRARTASWIGSIRNANREIAALGVPSQGNWIVGDRVINAAPAPGRPKAWSRVTTGNGNILGTDWISEGNL